MDTVQKCSDLKLLEGMLEKPAVGAQNSAKDAGTSDKPFFEGMAATYHPQSASDNTKRSAMVSANSSAALLQGTTASSPVNTGWKRSVLPVSVSASSTPNSTLRNRLDADALEDDGLMQTVMPGKDVANSSSVSLPSSAPRAMRLATNRGIFDDEDLEADDDDIDMDVEEAEEAEDPILLYQQPNSPRDRPIESGTSSPISTYRTASPPGSTTITPSSLLGPPPTTAASTPPPSRVLATPTTSTSPPPNSSRQVPSPPPNPGWFELPTNNGADTTSSNTGGSAVNDASLRPNSAKARRKGRARASNVTNRLTYAGTEEDVGLLRIAELARIPMPNFRKDYQVSILIQYSDSSKEVLEYKNRVHPECLASDIITACVAKTKKKIQSWNPPADKFTAFELIVPSKNDDDDEIVMDLDTPIWKYCFIPGEVARLVMRLRMRYDSTRLALKIRTDRSTLHNMMFHSSTPIAMVIERIQHKIKGTEQKGPPFTGLFVFDNKRGRFLESMNKTLADYRIKHMDIIQVKRRKLMELCLRDQPKKNLMVPLDLTAALLAEQLHDWLRLDPVDPSTLSLVKIVPKKGNMAEMQLVLHNTTEVRAFHLVKDDIFQLRRKVGKPEQSKLTLSGSSLISSSTTSSTASSYHSATSLAALHLSTPPASPDSRLAKSGSQTFTPTNPSSGASVTSPRTAIQPTTQHNSLKLASSQSASPNPILGGARSHVADTMGTVIATFQVAFAGNSHDSEAFGSGVSLQNAFLAERSIRRFPPPKLKLGEVGLFQTVYGIYLWDSSTRLSMLGDVHITNYRLVFCSYSDDTLSDYYVDVPLTTISRVEKTGDKSKPGLKVDCKDFRTLRFHFERSGKDNRRQMRRLLEDCLYPNFKQLFALAHKSSMLTGPQSIDGWSIFDLRKEFQRLGVGTGEKGSRWRISTLNETYLFSKTYPSMIAVPASVTDEELIPVFKYRSKGRLPALSWLNAKTGASITRCSQPLSGMTKKTSLDDANLINAIREAQGSADAKLHLLDARPRANAIANMAMGGGFEVMGGSAYSGCDLEFLNIGNIHVMRNSLSDLKSLLESQPYDNSFLARLEASGWLLHISLILQGAVKIVEHMQQRQSCVLHCSDGWDRTSQLSSVAMLLMDPYYRTTRGLCILIEKEWCSFGHKFASRNGHIAIDHVDKNYAHGERAPIFLQFIDCVYQIIRQFPLAFEFNENVLLCIMEHLYSCHFGTFLFDCERERKEADISSKTDSLWTYILDPNNQDKFNNIFYEPFDSVLPLGPTLADVRLWRSYYRRWYAPPDEDKINMEEKMRTLVVTAAKQADRIAQLELRLKAIEREGNTE